MLELIYALGATSFDFTRLDAFCSACFCTAGVALTEILKRNNRWLASTKRGDVASYYPSPAQLQSENEVLRVEISIVKYVQYLNYSVKLEPQLLL